MDLYPSEEQSAMVDGVARFLSERLPARRLVAAVGAAPGGEIAGTLQERAAWRDLAALGCFGIAVPTGSGGGLGLGLAEETLLFREFGRFLLSPCVLATSMAARLAAAASQEALVDELLSGRRRAALAVPAPRRDDADDACYLLDAAPGDLILICNPIEVELYDPGAFTAGAMVPGIDESLDFVRATHAAAATPLLAAGRAMTGCASTLAAAMLVGVAEAARDLAVHHAATREQFGRAIGGFQAIKHRCVDMAVRAESAWAQTVIAALTTLAPDGAFQAAAAKITATDAAVQNARACIQIHGAMGFTAEMEAHLYLKRAHVLDAAAGNLRAQRAALMAEEAPL